MNNFNGIRWIIPFVLSISTYACSDAAKESTEEQKTNSAPVTRIVPNQEFISATRQISFECRDSDINDLCSTYYTIQLDNTISPNAANEITPPGDLYHASFNLENLLPGGSIAPAKTVTIRYYSVDSFGNTEAENNKQYTFDVDAPLSTNVGVTPGGSSNLTESQWITLSCVDEVGGSGCKLIYYTVVDLGEKAPETQFFKTALYDPNIGFAQINRDATLFYFAEDAAGNQSPLTSANYQFSNPVANISNLQAVSGDRQVTLSWTNPSPLGSISGIKVIRNESQHPQNSNDGTELTLSLGEQYIDKLLTNDKPYYYGVYAYQSSPSTSYSSGETIAATPRAIQPPSDVSNFQVVPGDTQIELSWILPPNLDNFSHVQIRRDIGTAPLTVTDGVKVFESKTDPTLLNHIDEPLTNGLIYYYRIYVVDTAGQISSGVTGSAKAQNTIPGPVANFKAIAQDGYVDLQWGNPSDTDLASVHILRKLNSAPTAIDDGNVVIGCLTAIATTTCRDNTVTNGSTYYYAAYLLDSVGQNSVLTTVGPIAPKDLTPPGSTTQLTANVGDATVLLQWQNPIDSDFNGAKIIRSSVATITDATVTGATATDNSVFVTQLPDSDSSFRDTTTNGLVNGTLYYYSVFARDVAGNYSNLPATTTATPVGDNLAPTVSATAPLAGISNADPTTPVTVTFSEAVAAATLPDNFTLSNGANNIPGTVTGAGATASSAQFIADAGHLPLLTSITASVSSTITDLSGNSLNTQQPGAAPYQWTFTTADGKWGPTSDISGTWNWAVVSAVAFDAKGRGMAVWSRNTGTDMVAATGEIVAKYFSPDTGWESITNFVNCTQLDSANPAGCLSYRQGDSPEIAMDLAGNAVVVWQSSNRLYANRYLLDSGWSIPIDLHATGNPVDAQTPPKLVVDAVGTVTVAWSEYSTASTSSRKDIWAARFSPFAPGAVWNAQLPSAEMIEWNDEGNAEKVVLTVDNGGNVMAVWSKTNASNIRNAAYNYFHSQGNGKGWDQPTPSAGTLNTHPHVDISSNTFTNNYYNTNLAVNPSSSDAIAVWCHPEVGPLLTSSLLWAVHFDATTTSWSAAKPITNIANSASLPYCDVNENFVRLAMGSDGRAIVLWTSATGRVPHVNRYLPALQQWQGAVGLLSPSAKLAKIAIDPQGHALAMLTLASGEVQVHRILRDAVWEAASFTQATVVANAGTGTVASYPTLAVDNYGYALALWTHDIQTPGQVSTILHDYSLRASYFTYLQP